MGRGEGRPTAPAGAASGTPITLPPACLAFAMRTTLVAFCCLLEGVEWDDPTVTKGTPLLLLVLLASVP